VTSASLAERNKRGRGGKQGRDRKRVECSQARVGHGGLTFTQDVVSCSHTNEAGALVNRRGVLGEDSRRLPVMRRTILSMKEGGTVAIATRGASVCVSASGGSGAEAESSV
jgi:hypothetical protein